MSDEEDDSSDEEEEDVSEGKAQSRVTYFLSGVISGFFRNWGCFRRIDMLNVPTQSFPAASSQQRVAGTGVGQSGRNKVALKPGRSLMDWIRFAKSGHDLTGLRGCLIDVTEEELQKHKTRNDCWTCIRGMVYNISHYMEYHPGGEEELMKSAGIDGTELFDQVHRWVNYESMLKECLVGRMVVKAVTAKRAPAQKKDGLSQINGLAPPPSSLTMAPPAALPPPSSSLLLQPSVAPLPNKDARPRYDWFQTDVTVNLVVYTKRKIPSSGCTIADLQGGVLRLEVLLGKMSYMLHLRLSHEIEGGIAVHTASAVGKVQVSIRKQEKGKWAELGQPLEFHDSLLRRTDRVLFYRECALVSRTEVNHNTYVFRLGLPRGTVMHVPVGKHVYLKALVQDSEVVKPYTPVEQTLVPGTRDPPEGTDLFLMVKIYPDGVFTPHLDSLNIGEHLFVSNPEGSFSLRPLREVTHLYLLAAGTGFTPMARLIRLALQDLDGLRKTKLLFFNRQRRDILWYSQLDELAAHEQRFEVEYVLSEPCDGWTGKTGRVEESLLKDFLVRPNGSKCYVCVCGPSAFTQLTVGLVSQLGYSEDEIHAFQG